MESHLRYESARQGSRKGLGLRMIVPPGFLVHSPADIQVAQLSWSSLQSSAPSTEADKKASSTQARSIRALLVGSDGKPQGPGEEAASGLRADGVEVV
jgi:hypothetical protein